MDIEDLFNEDNYPVEEEKKTVLVIPEFDPCTGAIDNLDGIASSQKKSHGCSIGSKSLTCSSACQCKEESKDGFLPP